MKMQIKLLAAPPTKIQNKTLSKYELDRYFQTDSVESLIVTLKKGEFAGLFNFDVYLSAEYLGWVKDKHKLLNPPTFGTDLGFAKPYKLYDLSDKIQNGEPLSEADIARVVAELPQEIAERYLRFRLRNIDYEELRSSVTTKNSRAHKDEYSEHVKYKGLAVVGARVTYLGTPVHLSFQHRQVVRVFLQHPDAIVAPDIFISDPDIFNPNKDYDDARETLGKLIPAVHKKLKAVIGEKCIFNEPNEGWRLNIE